MEIKGFEIEKKISNAHADRVWSVDWSPDGALLASAGGDRCGKLWQNFNENNSFSDERTVR